MNRLPGVEWPANEPERTDLRLHVEWMQRVAAERQARAAAERAVREADPVWRQREAERRQGRARRQLLRQGFPAALLEQATWDQVPAAEREALHGWAAATQPRSLVIWGAIGVGKTSAAVLAAGLLAERGVDVGFVTAGELLESLARPGARPEWWTACQVLLLDDLGAEEPPLPYLAARFETLVNTRWTRRLTLLTTTNCGSLGFLTDRYGPAVSSRLRDRRQTVVLRWSQDQDRRTGEVAWRAG